MRFLWQGWHRYGWQSLLGLAIAFLIGLALPAISVPPPPHLPTPHSHPLPPSLANWQGPKQSGDYFDQVQPVNVGYLVWSQFPITVYIQPLTAVDSANVFLAKRSRVWVTAVQTAVQEWHPYLPLKLVDQAQGADISIWRSTPPLRFERDETGRSSDRRTLPLPRARSAETHFDLYVKQIPLHSNTFEPSSSGTAVDSSHPDLLSDFPLPVQTRIAFGIQETRSVSAGLLIASLPHSPLVRLSAHAEVPTPKLFHRVTIYIRPDQAADYLQAAARHELGHALGIWGHSPNQTDTMYFSQVRNPAKISARDLNTLKRVYEQPTSLGWSMPTVSEDQAAAGLRKRFANLNASPRSAFPSRSLSKNALRIGFEP